MPTHFLMCAQHLLNVKCRSSCKNLCVWLKTTLCLFVCAQRLLNILDPTRKLIKHRIYRDACVVVEGNYLKDLSVSAAGQALRLMCAMCHCAVWCLCKLGLVHLQM